MFRGLEERKLARSRRRFLEALTDLGYKSNQVVSSRHLGEYANNYIGRGGEVIIIPCEETNSETLRLNGFYEIFVKQ